MPTLLVIHHVPHERLGTFERAFTQAGCSIRAVNAYDPHAAWPSLVDVNGLVVMGGPQSVYQQDRYPYLTKELVLLRQAITHELPVLGVCLGAQLLAQALGGEVRPAEQEEIGWYPLMRESGADGDPLFAAFGHTETVFQWHGDTFTLPKGAVRLASSTLCQESLASSSGFHPESSRRMEQAFRHGKHVYGLQFHVEVTEAIIRAWMRTPVNQAELARLTGRIDPMTIRRQSPQHLGRLHALSQHVARTFCQCVTSESTRPARSPVHAYRV